MAFATLALPCAAYEVDPLECLNCGASMRIIALIDDAEVIERILQHLKLSGGARLMAHYLPVPDHSATSCLGQGREPGSLLQAHGLFDALAGLRQRLPGIGSRVGETDYLQRPHAFDFQCLQRFGFEIDEAGVVANAIE